MDKNTKKIYMVFENDKDDDGMEVSEGCFIQYDTLEDAVGNSNEGVEVFEASVKSLGIFIQQKSVVQVKSRTVKKANKR